MVAKRDFDVEFSESSEEQIITARALYEDQPTQLHYARLKGRDTWFSYIGHGGNNLDGSVSFDFPRSFREAADNAVLNAGYSLRTIDGQKSKEGELHQLYGGGSHIFPFITHGGNFSVYESENSVKPANPPQSGEVHIEIIDEQSDDITVQFEASDITPKNYVIEEAVLRRYAPLQRKENLPTIHIKS